jgi:nanoRNase/pAp phosphatase (c-di-AMP/oligoRNAs hydrolase)
MSCEVAIIYWKEKDKWIHSLRSKASVDVSEMAKKEGGGGLAQAAGFQLPALHPALIKGLNAGT